MPEQFEAWMDEMDTVLDQFMRDLPDDVSSKLDYSIESLDVLEDWWLGTYPSLQALRDDPSHDQWDAVTRYFGQVIVKQVGGEWAPNSTGPELISDLHPDNPDAAPFIPKTMLSMTLDRRTGGRLRRIAETNLRIRQEGE